MENRKGSILIIALITVLFLGALAVAVLGPAGTSQTLTDIRYCHKRAKIAADSAAERVKAIMCQDISPLPTVDDGISQCVISAINSNPKKWIPVSLADNNNIDEAGKTYPTIDMRNNSGVPIFDTGETDPNFPQFTTPTGEIVKYIVYTVSLGNGNAASYVSAEYGGQVVNIKMNYTRDLETAQIHPSYFHAVYAANTDDETYTFQVEEHTVTTYDAWGNPSTSSDTDAINGKIYIDGNIAFVNTPIINGDIKSTGTITGDADGTNVDLPGEYEIPPPDLNRTGEWFQSLKITNNGLSSDNANVVTDDSDGTEDGRIADFICPYEQTGESQSYIQNNPDATSTTQYMLDSNFGVEAGPGDPTYDSGTDSVIITVPAAYNNKAIYIPGDFWIDILNPTYIDFRTASGDPVNLTFIVSGNVYMTDGLNKGRYPGTTDGLGTLSVIAIENENGQGGNVNYGDPSQGGGQIDPIKAFLYAQNNFKWNPDAQNQGTFNINGNMTAGGIIDFTDRDSNDFVPITVTYDASIEDEDVRAALPCLPQGSGITIIPGSKFNQGSLQYLE